MPTDSVTMRLAAHLLSEYASALSARCCDDPDPATLALVSEAAGQELLSAYRATAGDDVEHLRRLSDIGQSGIARVLAGRLKAATKWDESADGRSNNSPMFLALVERVASIIRNDHGQTPEATARLILAQLSHVHSMVPVP